MHAAAVLLTGNLLTTAAQALESRTLEGGSTDNVVDSGGPVASGHWDAVENELRQASVSWGHKNPPEPRESGATRTATTRIVFAVSSTPFAICSGSRPARTSSTTWVPNLQSLHLVRSQHLLSVKLSRHLRTREARSERVSLTSRGVALIDGVTATCWRLTQMVAGAQVTANLPSGSGAGSPMIGFALSLVPQDEDRQAPARAHRSAVTGRDAGSCPDRACCSLPGAGEPRPATAGLCTLCPHRPVHVLRSCDPLVPQDRFKMKKIDFVIVGLVALACAQVMREPLPPQTVTFTPPPVAVSVGDTLGSTVVQVAVGERQLVLPGTAATTVVLAFDSRCPHCVQLAPVWAAWLRSHTSDARILAVSAQPLGVARSFAAAQGWSLETASVSEQGAGSGGHRLVRATPWLFLLDQDGVVQFESHGGDLHGLDEALDRLSGERARLMVRE